MKLSRFQYSMVLFLTILGLLFGMLQITACNKSPDDNQTSSDNSNNPPDEQTPEEQVAARYAELSQDIASSSSSNTLTDYYSQKFRFNGKDFNYKHQSLEYEIQNYSGVKCSYTNSYTALSAELVRVVEKASWRGIFNETGGTLLDSWEHVTFWALEEDGKWRNIGNQDEQWNWRYLPDQDPEEEVLSFVAKDGKRLSISHYAPQGAQISTIPLILCHGIAANRYTFDLLPQYSLAKYLAQHGYDVWLPELRGHGRSYFPDTWDAQSYDWKVEGYIVNDVPAVIDFVKGITSSEQVVWIGHSMGGMVVNGYLIHCALEGTDPGIKALITIGSPGYIDFKNKGQLLSPGWIFDYLFSNIDMLLESYPYLFNLENYSNVLMLLSLFGISENEFLSMIWNPENMDDAAATKLSYDGAHNICGDELRSFKAFYDARSFFTPDRSIVYKDSYQWITVPLLVINGAGDEIGITDSMRWYFDHAGSRSKTFRMFGTSGLEIVQNETGTGQTVTHDPYDCGHLDLVVGKTAPSTVYPYILNWLQQTLH